MTHRPAPRAFTLVELLVVIAILALLIGLTVTVGTRITNSSRGATTANVIRGLEASLSEWIALEGDIPPSVVQPRPSFPSEVLPMPIIDGRLRGAAEIDPALPSARLYTAVVMSSAAVAPVFQSIDSRFAKPTTYPNADDIAGQVPPANAYPALDLIDAWERPLRFVHPAFHGGHGAYADENDNMVTSRPYLEFTPDGNPVEYSRSYRPWRKGASGRTARWIGDADEGICPGGRPYFYSAGISGDPGIRADNVYGSVEPQFPAETARLK